jgi:hypothetical protein
MTHHAYRPVYCPGGCATDLFTLDNADTVTRPDGSVSCLPCWEMDLIQDDHDDDKDHDHDTPKEA